MKQHWRELDYWLWLWRKHVPSEANIVVVALVFVGLVGGGWVAADRLTAAHAEVAGTDAYVLETTAQKAITVREQGKIVVRLVPVVKRVKVYRTRLKYSTRVVTTPERIGTRTLTTRVPVVTRRLITVNGKTRTVVTTRLAPTTRTETAVETQTVTNTQNVTQPASTVTVARTSTVTDTQTVNQTVNQTQTATVTLPAETTTSTVTETVTVTRPKS